MSAPVIDLAGFDDPEGVAALPRSNGELVFDALGRGGFSGSWCISAGRVRSNGMSSRLI